MYKNMTSERISAKEKAEVPGEGWREIAMQKTISLRASLRAKNYPKDSALLKALRVSHREAMAQKQEYLNKWTCGPKCIKGEEDAI